MSELVTKFLKFSIVGATGVVVDFFFTFICKEKFKFNKYVANSIGFIIAATSNYWLNRIWSFESTNPDVYTEYFSFVGVAMVGLVINNTVLWLVNEKVGINFYVAKLFAIGVTTVWNFSINYAFVFE